MADPIQSGDALACEFAAYSIDRQQDSLQPKFPKFIGKFAEVPRCRAIAYI